MTTRAHRKVDLDKTKPNRNFLGSEVTELTLSV